MDNLKSDKLVVLIGASCNEEEGGIAAVHDLRVSILQEIADVR